MDFKERIKIWQGLENFRAVLLGLLVHDLSKINQTSLDKLFPGYEFKLEPSRKTQLIKALQDQQKVLDPDSEVYIGINNELEKLYTLDEELIIKRNTEDYRYEYVFKAVNKAANLKGFVKIINKHNPFHKGLVSWQAEKRNPMIFLIEMMPQKDKIFFHINLGKPDGLAVIAEEPDSYTWTHSMEVEYPELTAAEYGSISMDKNTKEIKLLDGNIPAAMALSKAQSLTDTGITIFENNVTLMNMYKKDLRDLDFDY